MTRMNARIRALVTDHAAKPGLELLGLGEPTHSEPAFGLARNDLFAGLAELGFGSIAIESDRVAGFLVDDFVRLGNGTLEDATGAGFSHGFGTREPNRRLVQWMRDYNAERAPEDRLSFHGFDGPLEFTAESPRRYLEHGRAYLDTTSGTSLGLGLGLGLGLCTVTADEIAALAGDDERWSRTEAVTDPAESPGATPEAYRLRTIADDLTTELDARAPELIAATSRLAWFRAKAYVESARGLLGYHAQAARPIDPAARWSRLAAVRAAMMARNLLDIRMLEADRGPTLVYAHNVHLQRNPTRMSMAGMDLAWHGTGALLDAWMPGRYAFVAGAFAPDDPSTAPENAPLEPATLATADAVLPVHTAGSS